MDKGYIPEGGVWTAAEREATKQENQTLLDAASRSSRDRLGSLIDVFELERAYRTVAALIRMGEELANADDSCVCSPHSDGCDWCERRINARALLAELKK